MNYNKINLYNLFPVANFIELDFTKLFICYIELHYCSKNESKSNMYVKKIKKDIKRFMACDIFSKDIVPTNI